MANSTTNERISVLNELIDSYESGKLKRDIGSLNRQNGIEASVTFGVPIIATVLSALLVNLTAMLAPIVIGAANIADKLGISKTMISSYFKDKAALQGRPDLLRAELQLAVIEQDSQKKEERLEAVQQRLLGYFE